MKRDIRLSYGQLELLKVICSFRFNWFSSLLEISLIKELYSCRQNLGRTLIRLEDLGLIESFLAINGNKFVYLSPKGKKLLGIQDMHFPKSKDVQMATLMKIKEVADIYSQLIKVLKDNPEVRITKWACNMTFKNFKFQNVNYKTVQRRINPYAYSEIEYKGVKRSFFIEIDYELFRVEFLRDRILKYFEYFCYGDWKNYFDTFPIVLFLSSKDEARINKLFPKETLFTAKKEAVNNRKKLEKSKNNYFRALGSFENIYKMDMYDNYSNFFDVSFVFINMKKESWVKEFVAELPDFNNIRINKFNSS